MKKLKLDTFNLRIYTIFSITYILIFFLLSFSYHIKYSEWQEGEVISKDISSSRFFQINTSINKSRIGIGKDLLEVKEKSFEEFLNTVDQELAKHPTFSNKNGIRTIADELLLNAYNSAKYSKSLREILKIFHENLKLVENLSYEQKETIWKIVEKTSKKFYVEKDDESLNKNKKTSLKYLIKPGQLIIEKGKKLTKTDINILKELKIKKKKIPLVNFISLFLLSFSIYILFLFYFFLFGRGILKNLRKISLLLVLLVLSVLLGVFILPTYFYIFPITLFAIMIAISINVNIGIAYVFTLTLLLSLIIDKYLFNFLLLLILSGTVSVYLVRHPRGRSVFSQAGIIIGILNFILIISLDVYNFHFSVFTIRNAILSLFSGFLSPIMVLGILPVLEGIFGISTSIRLLELSDPGHPLLRRLLQEAPGTYQHSAIVSNLAVAAASTIGADPLLARAGGFYHDIGKLKRPYFFIENQISDKNIHDEIQPTLSTLAIISHVKDGVELAKKYNLPEEIISIIQEHHGTSLVSYFYSRAIEKPSDKDELSEEDFRYPGPRPQSKESAIIMLADAVEAASRTLSNPTPTKIKNLIKSIFNRIIRDGQLEESPLTFRDLSLIESTFEKFLLSMFHSRIEYPKIKTKGAKNGN